MKDLAKKVCLDAANLIQRNGWCQGEYQIGKRHCLLGAVSSAAPNMFVYNEAISLVARSFRLPLTVDLAEWNDDKKRTKKQVIAALRKAGGKP